jgi:hypothetical protein
MSHLFDPGYSAEPFCTLCAEYPEADVYPASQSSIYCLPAAPTSSSLPQK